MPRNEDQRRTFKKKWLGRMGALAAAYLDVEAIDKELPFYDESHLYAREWYKIIPPANSPQFPGFVYSSVELAVDVCQDAQVQLTVGSVESACADKENMAIVILPHTLLGEAVRSRGFSLQDETAIMVAATNGMIVHEAAHLIKSPKDIAEARRMMKGASESYTIDPAFNGFINTCEDIYIEWWLREEYPNLAPFVEAAHEFWFHEADLGERLHTFWLSKDIEAESYSGSSFFDILIAMKNWRFADSPIWKGIIKEYNEELKCFRGLDKLEDRLEAIQVMWRKLRADPRLRWPSSKEDGSSCSSKFDSEGKLVGDKKACELQDEEGRTAHGVALTDLIDEINKELNKRNITIKIKKGQTNISEIPPMIVKVVEPSHSRVEPDRRFIPLAKRLRSVLTRNYAPGQPVKKGPKLVSTRLQRIVTDGKIFTYPEARKRTGKDFEIIILVDCSGSMSGGTPSKIVEAMRVGVAAYLSLRSARVRTVLLGHTSWRERLSRDEEKPVLYVFGEAKDTVERVKKRAARAFHSGFKYNNYDGFAVEKASTFFSNKPTKKWLIVISDGQPAGINYDGYEAIEHSRLAAEKVRDKGVDVVSITIEKGARKVNDRIYGKEKNIHTGSSKVLLDLVEAMFTRPKGDKDGKA